MSAILPVTLRAPYLCSLIKSPSSPHAGMPEWQYSGQQVHTRLDISVQVRHRTTSVIGSLRKKAIATSGLPYHPINNDSEQSHAQKMSGSRVSTQREDALKKLCSLRGYKRRGAEIKQIVECGHSASSVASCPGVTTPGFTPG